MSPNKTYGVLERPDEIMGAEIKTLPLPSSYADLKFEQIRLSHVPQSSKEVTPVILLTLYRPNDYNAFTPTLMRDMEQAFQLLDVDDRVKCIVVTGHGKMFCAGADLVERRTMSQEQVDKFLLDLRGTLGKLENLPMPTIAAIDGPALGGGVELALACDLRVAGHSVTKIGLPETKLGIIPGAGGTQRLTRLLGLAKAKNLIFTGRALTAQEALEYGK